MKKIIISASLLIAFTAYAAAQTTPVKVDTKVTTHKTKVKKTGKNVPVNSSNQKTTTTQNGYQISNRYNF